jgi:hypothetical protein
VVLLLYRQLYGPILGRASTLYSSRASFQDSTRAESSQMFAWDILAEKRILRALMTLRGCFLVFADPFVQVPKYKRNNKSRIRLPVWCFHILFLTLLISFQNIATLLVISFSHITTYMSCIIPGYKLYKTVNVTCEMEGISQGLLGVLSWVIPVFLQVKFLHFEFF